jgi:cytochrome c peroxidase
MNHPLQAQPIFGVASTGPWLHKGSMPTLSAFIPLLFGNHNEVGGELDTEAEQDLLVFLEARTETISSPFLNPDGSLTPAAEAGKLVFEGSAGCANCHEEPLFLPPAGNPATIPAGVGTGLVPANVPSLMGLWVTAPYLSNGFAPTLMDVLTLNTMDLHGSTTLLTQQELDDLVEYLRSL